MSDMSKENKKRSYDCLHARHCAVCVFSVLGAESGIRVFCLLDQFVHQAIVRGAGVMEALPVFVDGICVLEK
jgi:hypothetical protein